MNTNTLRVLMATVHAYPGCNEEVSADHDVIYFGGPAPKDMSDGDRMIMTNCGAIWDERHGCWRVLT